MGIWDMGVLFGLSIIYCYVMPFYSEGKSRLQLHINNCTVLVLFSARMFQYATRYSSGPTEHIFEKPCFITHLNNCFSQFNEYID